MTRSEIRALVRKSLGETTESFWSDTELNTWIDDGGYDLAFRTKSIRANGYITTTSAGEYTISTDLASNVLTVLDVYYKVSGTTWTKLALMSREELDTRYPTWRSDTAGTPLIAYFDMEEGTIGFYVAPAAGQYGTSYARVYYAVNFTDLALDTSVPTLPTYLHRAIAYYVIAYGFEQRGYGDKSNDAWKKYDTMISTYLKERIVNKDQRESAETSIGKGVEK